MENTTDIGARVRTKLERYNLYVESLGKPNAGTNGGGDEYYAARLGYMGPATEAQINSLAHAFKGEMPPELRAFYKTCGGIAPLEEDAADFGDGVIKIFAPGYLLQKLQEPPEPAAKGLLRSLGSFLQKTPKWKSPPKLGKLHSLGLVDMMRFGWGPRADFDGNIPAAMQQALNARYKCIGWYQLEWGATEGYYIFFDENGSFGTVYFSQDEYGELLKQLETLLGAGVPKQSLENLLEQALEEMKKSIDKDY